MPTVSQSSGRSKKENRLQDKKDMMMKKTAVRYSATIAFFLFLLIFSSGCSEKIGDIREAPEQFQGKTVRIKGTVTEVVEIPFTDKGVFQVSDGSGKIWVVPSGVFPREKETIRVKGMVERGFSFGGTNYGIILKESRK